MFKNLVKFALVTAVATLIVTFPTFAFATGPRAPHYSAPHMSMSTRGFDQVVINTTVSARTHIGNSLSIGNSADCGCPTRQLVRGSRISAITYRGNATSIGNSR